MNNEITEMFANAIQIDHLTNEQVEQILKMFGEN